MRVQCFAQELNTMSPARVRSRTRTRSEVELTNHEATAPPWLSSNFFLYINDVSFWCVEITSFADITSDSNIARKFEDLYQDRDTVDLWVAGLAEEHEHGSELGPTFRT